MITDFLNLTKQMHQETQFRNRQYSEKKLLQLLKQPTVFTHIEYDGEKAIGFMIGLVHEQWFGNDKQASDLAVYVIPEYRGKGHAQLMIAKFENWAKAKGAKDVYLGISTGIHPEKTMGLYSKLGYTPLGALSKKEL